MANSELKKVSVSVKLENGTDKDGNMKYVSVSLGSMNKDKFDADKALTVESALANCLAKTVSSVEKTEVSTITAA